LDISHGSAEFASRFQEKFRAASVVNTCLLKSGRRQNLVRPRGPALDLSARVPLERSGPNDIARQKFSAVVELEKPALIQIACPASPANFMSRTEHYSRQAAPGRVRYRAAVARHNLDRGCGDYLLELGWLGDAGSCPTEVNALIVALLSSCCRALH